MSRPRYAGLNLLYYVPLMPLMWLAALLRRPRVFIGNGVAATLFLWPISVLFRGRLFVAYHGYLGHFGRTTTRAIRWFLPKCSGVFVNSQTSFDDLARFVPSESIVLVNHWASARFFDCSLSRETNRPLRLMFVGRLDEEKFAQCLRVSEALAGEGVAELWVVGDGPMAGRVRESSGIRLLGYISDQDHLASLYASADLVWAPADTTYVSLPGVEGLASGCPLIIGDVPAVTPRAQAGLRIPRDLLPNEIAHIVDGRDDSEAITVLRGYASNGVSAAAREAARKYARAHHSPANLSDMLKVLSK